jgi:hypothetical protein
MDDDGHSISFKVLRRGTPIRSSDGVQLGTVRRVQEAKRENIFDGIVVDTSDGTRFIDAPEVRRIAERAVTVTFEVAEAEAHMRPMPSRMGDFLRNTKTARRAKRLGARARESWDRR